ncbi:MAG: hypothetical protein PHG63_00870 [Candidatus Dojkabacteria bacterium]|nr:hypothetical protein [Candidatus Dojkabacteria bacterium]
MENLDLMTSYNVLLFHFVDMLSRWDYFVEPYTFNFFKSTWGISKQDRAHLQAYASIRTRIGWDQETALFEWAYRGFPNNDSFSPLLEHIQYFENRIDRSGRDVKSILKQELHEVKKCRKYLEQKFTKVHLTTIVAQLSKLFGTNTQNTRINVFLAASLVKGSCQAGANGNGIYTEVPPNDFKGAYQAIVHEYLHKMVRPHEYFESIVDPELKVLYHSTIDEVYEDKMFHFFEEIVIHAVTDVILFHSNPQDELVYAQKRQGIEEKRRKREVHLWRATQLVTPILSGYLDGEKSKEETLEALNDTLKSYLEKYR